jgi:hypothetical protein
MLGNTDVVEEIEIAYASPLMVRPNGCVRQGYASWKYPFDLIARVVGEMSLGDQTDDPVAFVEPGDSRRNCEQVEEQKRREERECQ